VSLLVLLLLQADTLGGDWGGARTDLAEKGVSWQLLYTGEVLANVHGGLDPGGDYMGILDAYLDLDFEAMMDWTGGSARLNFFWAAGDGITNDYVGDLFRVSNIEAKDALRVYELWVQQKAGVFTFRAGLLAADTEFALIEAAYQFVNGAFGALPTLSLNEAAPVYPLGALGGLVTADLGSGIVLKAGVYEGSADDEYLNETGLNVDLEDDEGILTFLEAAGSWEGTSAKAGFLMHTVSDHDRHFTFYGIVQQAIWLAGPVVFARAGVAEEVHSTLWKSVETGVSWKGPFAGRPKDELLLGFVYGRLSRVFVAAQPAPSEWRYESVVELSYRFEVLPWLVVQPDVQFVRHPGGTETVEDAWVVGLRIDVAF
jgi:porin